MMMQRTLSKLLCKKKIVHSPYRGSIFLNNKTNNSLSKHLKRSQSTLTNYNLFQNKDSNIKLLNKLDENTCLVNDVRVKVLNNSLYLFDVPQYGVGVSEADLKHKENEHSVFFGWDAKYLRIFELIEPTPEILVIGTGSRMELFPKDLKTYFFDLGIQVEVQASRTAVSTYNVLVSEGRRVSCLILPQIPTSSRTKEYLVEVKSGPLPNVEDRYKTKAE
ncbi:hypothetical protein HK099_005660 [Clydaea vesicula]|uniref:NADH dehydrogenase [ubiquinone] 1 alpha subcomplex assembly factor 3 n=1 Tax=Clydaea vesicula TaxID=447962 RepID=A0AAD5XZH1_9FUNG|nr:hypothetical protein HK099_005660 [Clydaea vesicula]